MSWSERFSALAAHFGSQYKLAAELNMSQGNVHKYIAGDRKPGAEVLDRLVSIGVSPHWLMTGQGEMMWSDVKKGLVAEPNLEYIEGGNGGQAVSLPPDEDFIPQSARDVYEALGEFYGGKPDWTQLPDDKQEPFLKAYQLMIAEIDDANEEYADGVRELAAIRLRKIKASIRTYSARARDAYFGTGLPF